YDSTTVASPSPRFRLAAALPSATRAGSLLLPAPGRLPPPSTSLPEPMPTPLLSVKTRGGGVEKNPAEMRGGLFHLNGVAEWPLRIAIALGDERLDVRVTLGPVPGPHHSLQGADVLTIGLLALGDRGEEVGSALGGGRRGRLSRPGVGALDRPFLPPPVAGVSRGLSRWLLGYGVLADTRQQKILHGLQAGRQLSHRVLERQQAGDVIGLVVLDALDGIEAGSQGRLLLGDLG